MPLQPPAAVCEAPGRNQLAPESTPETPARPRPKVVAALLQAPRERDKLGKAAHEPSYGAAQKPLEGRDGGVRQGCRGGGEAGTLVAGTDMAPDSIKGPSLLLTL